MKLYTTIARSLTTLMPVLLGMFAITAYLIFESADLISERLPESMTGWTRKSASYFVAIGLHLTVLNTAINSKLVGRLYAFLFAIAAFLITAIYFDAFNHADKDATQILFGYLISTFIGLANYVYVDLFVAKWKEYLGDREINIAYQKAKEQINELTIANERLTTSNEDLTITNEKLTNSNGELRIANEELTKTNGELTSNIKSLRKINDALIDDNKNLNQKVSELSHNNDALLDDARELNELRNELTKKIDAFNRIDQDYTDLQNKYTKLESDRDRQILAASEGRLCTDCLSILKNKQALSRHKRDCPVYKAKANSNHNGSSVPT